MRDVRGRVRTAVWTPLSPFHVSWRIGSLSAVLNPTRESATGVADWWTPTDAAQFERRARLLVDQYNTEEVLPGIHVIALSDRKSIAR